MSEMLISAFVYKLRSRTAGEITRGLLTNLTPHALQTWALLPLLFLWQTVINSPDIVSSD